MTDIDRVRQGEIAHTLAQSARKRFEDRVAEARQRVKAAFDAECKAADDELAAVLKSLRTRCQNGTLTEEDLKS